MVFGVRVGFQMCSTLSMELSEVWMTVSEAFRSSSFRFARFPYEYVLPNDVTGLCQISVVDRDG